MKKQLQQNSAWLNDSNVNKQGSLGRLLGTRGLRKQQLCASMLSQGKGICLRVEARAMSTGSGLPLRCRAFNATVGRKSSSAPLSSSHTFPFSSGRKTHESLKAQPLFAPLQTHCYHLAQSSTACNVHKQDSCWVYTGSGALTQEELGDMGSV